MHRIGLAFRVFFQVLFQGEIARRVEQSLVADAQPEPPKLETPAKAKTPAKPAAPLRSEALTLLAALQREARFLDFIQEPLASYSDAQIGAAARQVHRDCQAVIERMFAPKPLLDQPEGSAVELPSGFDAGRFRLTGNVAGEPPFHGQLVHHGWEAAHCQLPEWSGSGEAARVIAPAEVELT